MKRIQILLISISFLLFSNMAFSQTDYLDATDAQEGILKWKFQTSGTSVHSPAISLDGTIYLGDKFYFDLLNQGSYLYALNPNGTIKWKIIQDYITFNKSPLIGEDGSIFTVGQIYGVEYNALIVYGNDGKNLWSFSKGEGYTLKNIAYGNLNKIYINYIGKPNSPFINHNIKILDNEGTVTGEMLTGCNQIFIGSSGTIYFDWQGNINSFNSNGIIKNIYFSSKDDTLLAIGKEDNLFISGSSFRVLQSNGTLLWEYPIPGAKNCIIDNSGIVYATNNSEYLYAINSDGSLKWKYSDDKLGKNIIKSLCIGSDGAIYFTNAINNSNYIYCLNYNGTFRWKFQTTRSIPGNAFPLLDNNGSLYIIDSAGTLYAIQTSSYGYQKYSPWPCFGHDNGHTFNSGMVYTSVEEDSKKSIPNEFSLFQNYPNPFNSSTTITFNIRNPGKVEISVYNLNGQRVLTLLDDFLYSGNHSIVWNANRCPSGIYLIKLKNSSQNIIIKTLLLK